MSNKKYAVLLIILFLGFSVSGCDSLTEIPYGVWQSEDPCLIMYFDDTEDEDTGLFKGIYYINGEFKDVLLSIDTHQGGKLVIYDSSAYTGSVIKGSFEYVHFNDFISIEDKKLIYSLGDKWVEKTGYKEIIFEKISDYSPPPSLSPIVADVVKKPNGAI